ncbi:MAG: hypothetical protein HOY79_46810 [Streptomyces sp.]|nr:hypothetical protein [Streptomyces sp.]
MVGADGAQAAWLLAQHADADLEFQRGCLSLMLDGLEAGTADSAHVAFLSDLILVAEDRPQLYGTQFRVLGGLPVKIEEPDKLDARRAVMGLGSFEDYARGFRPRHGG